MNGTAAKLDPVPKRGGLIDKRMFALEGDMVRVMLNTSEYPEGLKR